MTQRLLALGIALRYREKETGAALFIRDYKVLMSMNNGNLEHEFHSSDQEQDRADKINAALLQTIKDEELQTFVTTKTKSTADMLRQGGNLPADLSILIYPDGRIGYATEETKLRESPELHTITSEISAQIKIKVAEHISGGYRESIASIVKTFSDTVSVSSDHRVVSLPSEEHKEPIITTHEAEIFVTGFIVDFVD